MATALHHHVCPGRRAALALALAAGCGGPARARPPAPADGSFADAARGRELPWRLRLPAGAGPWPLVLYSHGLGGSREGGAAWGNAWAAGGVAVLHLQHPGSDSAIWRGGPSSARAAASAEQLLARVADLRFAIDEIARRAAAGEAPWPGIALDALGVGGHSFGAVTTQAVAGQRHAAGSSGADARPRAFVAFSPSLPARGGLSPAQAFGGVTRPFMACTGSLDGSPLDPGISGSQRAQVFDGLPPGQRALLWLDGADHNTFGGGRPGGARAGAALDARRPALAREREAAHEALIARLTTLWWQWRLAGDEGAMRWLQQAQAALAAPDRLLLG